MKEGELKGKVFGIKGVDLVEIVGSFVAIFISDLLCFSEIHGPFPDTEIFV